MRQVDRDRWRQRRLTALYLWDKRYKSTHRYHSLYTGLAELYNRDPFRQDKFNLLHNNK